MMVAERPQVRIDDVLVEFGTLRLRPGDTLVVMVRDHISPGAAQRIKDILRPVIDAGCKILVLEEGMTLARLSQEDGEE